MTEPMEGNRLGVLIAGAGVAGLEAMLALDDLAADRVDLTLLAPTDRFEYRPLQVAEPFGRRDTIDLDLAPLVERASARHVRDSLAAVDPGARRVTTGSGGELSYDALIIALGAHPVDVVPGALTFSDGAHRDRFGGILSELGHRGVKRLAFVVPPESTWSIAAYELALLTARERDIRALLDVEVSVVTHETAPLEAFGAPVTQLVTGRLEEAGVDLRLDTVVEEFSGGELRLAGGGSLPADRAVALPGLEVPEIPGVPQRRHGFIETDVQMHVFGLEQVWAVGDVTSFPIKQGGLAAQQADVAARAIAARAGAHVPVQPFQPILRAAMLTGGAPEYMRRTLATGSVGQATEGQELWQPATKLAGSHIGPYLAEVGVDAQAGRRFSDLEGTPRDDDRLRHDRAIALILAAAEADAEGGDYGGALRWLAVAERLEFILPQEYVTRRDEWLARLDRSAAPSAAAARIDPTLIDADAALSDLRRRIGWLREIERRRGGEMQADLTHLDDGMEHLMRLSRQTDSVGR